LWCCREEAAEEEMRGSVSMYQLIVPAASPTLALAKATLAMFLASTHRPQQAIPLLSEALNAMGKVGARRGKMWRGWGGGRELLSLHQLRPSI
jgi:hypothetical protein